MKVAPPKIIILYWIAYPGVIATDISWVVTHNAKYLRSNNVRCYASYSIKLNISTGQKSFQVPTFRMRIAGVPPRPVPPLPPSPVLSRDLSFMMLTWRKWNPNWPPLRNTLHQSTPFHSEYPESPCEISCYVNTKWLVDASYGNDGG